MQGSEFFLMTALIGATLAYIICDLSGGRRARKTLEAVSEVLEETRLHIQHAKLHYENITKAYNELMAEYDETMKKQYMIGYMNAVLKHKNEKEEQSNEVHDTQENS